MCYNFAAEGVHTKILCCRVYSIEIELFYLKKKQKNLFLSHLCGLRGNAHNSMYSSLVDFPFVIIELFSLSPIRLRRYKQISVEVSVSRRRWVALSANFRRKGASSTNYCWLGTPVLVF